jgi:protocatechuate 3,4-dioxygenase beta subunit
MRALPKISIPRLLASLVARAKGVRSTLCAALLALALAMAVFGQASPSGGSKGAEAERASVRGVVRDAVSGEPIEGITVHVDTTRTSFQGGSLGLAPGADARGLAVSDAQGRFALDNIPPGRRSIRAMNPKDFFSRGIRFVELRPGEVRDDFDVRLSRPATISGRVLDDQGEPLPGAVVYVVVHEYYLGEARYYLRYMGFADDTGHYEIERVPEGQKIRLMAQMPPPNFDALADANAPADPARRRPAYAPVFYPDVPNPEAATQLLLKSGERRDGIDFVIRRERSLCAEGTFDASPGVGRIRFSLSEAQPTYGTTGRIGFYGRTVGGLLEASKPFRLCGLAPGHYRLTAVNDTAGGAELTHYSVTPFTLADRDLKNLRVALQTPYKVPFRIDWAGGPPKDLQLGLVPVYLEALFRAYYMGEGRQGSSEVPGQGELGAVLADTYGVTVRLKNPAPNRVDLFVPPDQITSGVYVKDIRYGDASAMHLPIVVGGQAADQEIRILLAHDAGSVTARVVDEEGKPVGDSYVHLLPMEAGSEGALADRILTGQTDQNGTHLWQQNIPPGTYRAVASHTQVDYSPDGIHALWQARSQAPEITVAPNGRAEVKVVIEKER